MTAPGHRHNEQQGSKVHVIFCGKVHTWAEHMGCTHGVHTRGVCVGCTHGVHTQGAHVG